MTSHLLRLLYVFIAFSLLTACITPPALPVKTNPTGVATPTVAQLANFDQQPWAATSPDNLWQVEGLTALPQAGGEQYYTEMRVKKADGSAEWLPVAAWRNFGLGYTVPHPVHWSPDGRYLYFTNAPVPDGCGLFVNASDLQHLNLAEGTVTEVLPYGLTWSLAIAPNGKTVAYSKDDQLYLLDLFTEDYASVRVEGLEPNAMWGNFIWSPDSQQLVFTIAYAPCQPPTWRHALLSMDVQSLSVTTLLEPDQRRFTITEWTTATQLLLTDAEKQPWVLDIASGALSQGTE